MSAVRTQRIASFDGSELAVHRVGEGRPVLLLHGLFSSAEMNWIRFGHAAKLAEAGFEVIMPDLRAHGDSAKPHDPAGLSARRVAARPRGRDRGARACRVRPCRLLARVAHGGRRGRGRGCSAQAGPGGDGARRGWRDGSGVRRSSSTRSTVSARSSGAIRPGSRSSS